MTEIDIATAGRFLPVPMPEFSLHAHQRLADGLRDAALQQFDQAIAGLTEGGDIDPAIHEARKAMKRIRAMLRLVRPVISHDVYRAENGILRDTARMIAPIRDGRVMVDTVRDLRERFALQLRPTALDGLEQALAARHQRTRAVLMHDHGAVRQTVYVLRSARARYASWPNEDDAVNGRNAIPHRYESVGKGLEATYRRGRDEMRTAIDHPTAEHFHLWRKRAKYLRHQTELLMPLWPEVLEGYAGTLHQLGEVLGAEHDLAELLRLVVHVPDLAADPIERSLLVALAQHRRREFQTTAITIGRRIYCERPGDFTRRHQAYWEAWETETRPAETAL